MILSAKLGIINECATEYLAMPITIIQNKRASFEKLSCVVTLAPIDSISGLLTAHGRATEQASLISLPNKLSPAGAEALQ
jgi:hypothetical protein